MFYYKKKNNPTINDIIVYPNMKTLIKYEWITRNTYMFERKNWVIVDAYYLAEAKWEFSHYKKWYIRFTDIRTIENAVAAIKRKKTRKVLSNTDDGNNTKGS
jgi:NRPS condensation-like uncharacterized protein